MKRCCIVMERAANMPTSCWGRYVRVGAVEVDAELLVELGRSEPAMLSERARGVVAVRDTWERQHKGETDRCAAAQAIAAAHEVCDERNEELGDEAREGLRMLEALVSRRRALRQMGVGYDRAAAKLSADLRVSAVEAEVAVQLDSALASGSVDEHMGERLAVALQDGAAWLVEAYLEGRLDGHDVPRVSWRAGR